MRWTNRAMDEELEGDWCSCGCFDCETFVHCGSPSCCPDWYDEVDEARYWHEQKAQWEQQNPGQEWLGLY